MKKALFICLVCILPAFAFAQNDISEDFYTDIKDITNVVHLDDHVSVMQINISNDSFDLAAVDENMRLLWQVTIPGYAVNIGKYKNKIAAVAATEHSTLKGNGNTYKAFLLDPLKGKTLVEKVIYEDNNDFVEIPKVLIGDDYFKFAMRQTAVTRKMHVGIPLFFVFQIHSWTKEANETQKLDVLDLNEKLETVYKVNPVVNGTFINIKCNTQADLFVSMMNGPDIEVYKYPAGKMSPSAQLKADVTIKPNNDMNLDQLILFTTSKTKPNDLFYTMLYMNENKDPELLVGKMDFANNTKKAYTQVFTKADIKAAEKGFVPLNKKLNDPDIGSPKSLTIKNLVKTDGGLVVSIGGEYAVASQYGSYMQGMSLVLNGFDDDLKPIFEQFFPTHYYYPNQTLPTGFHAVKNKLYVAGNTKKGGGTIGVYGVLDLTTGQWDYMDFLTKDSLKGYLDGDDILWFGKSFIAPYLKAHGMFSLKYNLGLQQNQY